MSQSHFTLMIGYVFLYVWLGFDWFHNEFIDLASGHVFPRESKLTFYTTHAHLRPMPCIVRQHQEKLVGYFDITLPCPELQKTLKVKLILKYNALSMFNT